MSYFFSKSDPTRAKPPLRRPKIVANTILDQITRQFAFRNRFFRAGGSKWCLEGSLGISGRCWMAFGALLGSLGALERSRGALGRSWGALGVLLGALRVLLVALGALLGRS